MDNIVIGLLGSRLDRAGFDDKRFERWRPSIAVTQHAEFPLKRFELIYEPNTSDLLALTLSDFKTLCPDMIVNTHAVNWKDPWDFEAVYSELYRVVESLNFNPEQENYFTHISTGSHVCQICLFLLTEARFIPGKLLQSSPSKHDKASGVHGTIRDIDLDLSKYDQIASRFATESADANKYLKDGIETRNAAFNQMIEQIEKVAIRSSAPILLTGPTGAGKSRLAKRIFALKKQRMTLKGRLVEVNCATLRGDNAMSALFGHAKGAFTGAQTERAGLLREANHGVLFLDEIGELGLDEQAMLLKAIEDKTFMPLGSDKEAYSDFQLIAGTNQNLHQLIKTGKFREDLLARINLWTYELPSLRNRIEDLEPNIHFELNKITKLVGYKVSFNEAALNKYLEFCTSPQALWLANFRDLNASITRMATLAEGGRITLEIVKNEIGKLLQNWSYPTAEKEKVLLSNLTNLIAEPALSQIDLFEQVQLSQVIKLCQNCKTIAEAGRLLFNKSRLQKTSPNDTHRLKVYLQKYNLAFTDLIR